MDHISVYVLHYDGLIYGSAYIRGGGLLYMEWCGD